MTTLNASLNFNFASSEAVRIAQAERAAQETIATQLRQPSASAPFAPGTTITARYQYKVGEDGVLYPIKTTISTETFSTIASPQNIPGKTARHERNSEDYLRQQGRSSTPRFADFVPVRVGLSPSDEVALFAERGNLVQARQESILQSQTITASIASLAQASDENGNAVEAEVITLRSRAEDLRKQRAQLSVAGLYARNNDIVYNVAPISQLAA